MRRNDYEARVAHLAGEKALRNRQSAAGYGYSNCSGQERRESRSRSIRLAHADLAERRFSKLATGRRRGGCDAAKLRAQGNGREDSVRPYLRGHTIFSQP